jgi:putative membrane protein
MKLIGWLLGLTYFVLVLAFALNNTGLVTLNFSSRIALDAPLVVVIVACFLAGILLGFLALLPTVFRLKRQVSQLTRSTRLSPAAREAAAESFGDRLASAARNVGAVGIEIDTRFPR